MRSAKRSSPQWMIYGATGFTGRLLAEEAVRRGFRPVLAGRSGAKLEPLARQLGLDMVVVELEDTRGLMAVLEDVWLVLHAAGPFVRTSMPMLRACLAAGTHYLDISGEPSVFENTLRHDAEARRRGVVLMSGVGFDIIPTDCLARHVAEKVPGAHSLELALTSTTRVTAGTLKSSLELLSSGGWVRRNGQLWPFPLGEGARRMLFPDGEHIVIPALWADLVTAWHTTGIPNITVFLAVPGGATGAEVTRLAAPLLERLLRVRAVRERAEQFIDLQLVTPAPVLRQWERGYIWARAWAPDGRHAEAWLETRAGYAFTALSGVRAVERVLSEELKGALTPARAFGADFVLSIAGSHRWDGWATDARVQRFL
ncbi:hypothetical protein BO221_50730 [Archangium sp. Cb G35]|uniref:saccharopine dehydrogenase family protein n=1 Tax=Archangium sp. Cb G35 TaxID=1920190 RepID=UPI0009379948|nr:saccharopine dehydrogenase NADP-binding domain-containing protein [Archangium sp. Cb G35]OJT16299.1 hypothetical protein BO221_50730 [Archangium sp. Cb G35]